MKTISLATLLFTGSFLTASADHTCANDRRLGALVLNVERSTDCLLDDLKGELVHCGLWKPRGAYADLYSAALNLEAGGRALLKTYNKGRSYDHLHAVACNLSESVNHALASAHCVRVSRNIHADLRAVASSIAAVVNHVDTYAGGAYEDYDRPSRRDRYEYEDRRDRYEYEDRHERGYEPDYDRGYYREDSYSRGARTTPGAVLRDRLRNASNSRVPLRPEFSWRLR